MQAIKTTKEAAHKTKAIYKKYGAGFNLNQLTNRELYIWVVYQTIGFGIDDANLNATIHMNEGRNEVLKSFTHIEENFEDLKN